LKDKITIEKVYNTSYLAMKYLLDQLDGDLSSKIVILGEDGLADEFRNAGF